MNILIHGAGFVNKGAQLMLTAVCHRLRESGLDADLFISPLAGDHLERGRLGLGGLFPPEEHYSAGVKFTLRRWLLSAAGSVVPRRLWERYAVCPLGRMDAFIDISGYAFADIFGHHNLDRTARLAASFHRRGKPVLFLPQMWGPFDDPRVARAMTGLAGNADVLYARDRVSFRCLAGLGEGEPRLKLAPDLSISLPAADAAVPTPEAPFCCLVPNYRMIDRGGWGGRHAALLAQAAGLARQRGVEPVLLVHENAAEDHDLARSIATSSGNEITVFFDDDPLVLKAFISKSHCLVGSRYHGIVAALSQGVPALAMGWAHKYPELLADFGCGRLAFDETHTDDEILRSVAGLLDQDTNREHRAGIGGAVPAMLAGNEEMWAEVIALLQSGRSRPGQPTSNR